MKNLNAEARRRGADGFPKARPPGKPIARFFHQAWQIVYATLREIFDESAYERFLMQTGVRRSVESYRAFVRQSEAASAKKPRCC
jgi:hypothetical protein